MREKVSIHIYVMYAEGRLPSRRVSKGYRLQEKCRMRGDKGGIKQYAGYPKRRNGFHSKRGVGII